MQACMTNMCRATKVQGGTCPLPHDLLSQLNLSCCRFLQTLDKEFSDHLQNMAVQIQWNIEERATETAQHLQTLLADMGKADPSLEGQIGRAQQEMQDICCTRISQAVEAVRDTVAVAKHRLEQQTNDASSEFQRKVAAVFKRIVRCGGVRNGSPAPTIPESWPCCPADVTKSCKVWRSTGALLEGEGGQRPKLLYGNMPGGKDPQNAVELLKTLNETCSQHLQALDRKFSGRLSSLVQELQSNSHESGGLTSQRLKELVASLDTSHASLNELSNAQRSVEAAMYHEIAELGDMVEGIATDSRRSLEEALENASRQFQGKVATVLGLEPPASVQSTSTGT